MSRKKVVIRNEKVKRKKLETNEPNIYKEKARRKRSLYDMYVEHLVYCEISERARIGTEETGPIAVGER